MISRTGSPNNLLSFGPPKPNPCFLVEDYIWLDRDGRATSPPLHGPGDPFEAKLPCSRRNSSANSEANSAKIRRKAHSTIRQVDVELTPNDNLGLTIRGGKEYGLGIYVTAVDEDSAACQYGLRPGDEILEVNGRPFHHVTHDKAARMLKFSKRLTMAVRDVGKIPHSPSSGNNSVERSSKASSSGGSASTIASMWSPRELDGKWPPSTNDKEDIDHAQNLNRIASFVQECKSSMDPNGTEMAKMDVSHFNGPHVPNCSTANNFSSQGFRAGSRVRGTPTSTMETALNGSIKRCISGAKNRNHRPNVRALTNETPELTMVLEKAQVLLNSDEYSALGMVLVDYLSGATAIEDFISDLSQIIAGGEKSSFFTEIREIVRPQDQGRFDRFVYQDNDPSLYQLFPSKDFDAEPSDNETMQDMADLMRSLPPAGTFDNGEEEEEEEEEEDDENLPLLINQAYEGSNQAQLRPLPSAQENGIHRLHRRGTNKSIMDGHNDGDGMDLSCQQHFKPGLYNHAHPPQVVPFSFRSNGTGGGLDPFHFLNTSLGPSSSSSSSCPSSQNNHLQHLDHRHSMRRNSNMGPESEYMSGRNFHTSHSGSGRCLPFGLDEDEREALHPRQRPFSMSAMTDPEPGTTPPANSLFSRNERGETASARGELAHGPMAFRESTMIPVVPRDPYQTGDDRTYTVRIAKNWPTLGMAIEGGSNTQQPLARIIAIQPNGAAFDVSGLRVGQLIQEVDGIQLAGLPHEKAARIIAERFALKSHRELVLVVKDQKQTPAEKRHRFMPPQQ